MRLSISLAGAAALALTLAACSSTTPSEPTSAPEPTETTTSEEPSEAPVDAGSLVIWVDETRQAAVQAAASSFE